MDQEHKKHDGEIMSAVAAHRNSVMVLSLLFLYIKHPVCVGGKQDSCFLLSLLEPHQSVSWKLLLFSIVLLNVKL